MPVHPLPRLMKEEPALVARANRIAMLPPGLVVGCGLASSGRTTTLLGIAHAMAAGEREVVLLASRPDEFEVFQPLPAGWREVEVTQDAAGWSAALEAQPPDALVVLTLSRLNAPIACRAAQRQWVLGGLETPLVSVDTAYALREMDVSYATFVATVRCIWSQSLLESLCPECARPAVLSAADLEYLFPTGDPPGQPSH